MTHTLPKAARSGRASHYPTHDLAPPEAWREAALDAMVMWDMWPQPDETPRQSLHRLMAVEQMVALDPAVSTDARKLIELGRAQSARASWQPIGVLIREGVAPFDGVVIDLWARVFFTNRFGLKRTMLEYRIPDCCWHHGKWCDAAGNPHEVLNGRRTDLEVTHWMIPPEGPE